MNSSFDKEKIKQLEEKAEEFHKQQKYSETLDILEEVLILKRGVYGEKSEDYQNTCDKLCEICNFIGILCLNNEKFDQCISFLKKAEILGSNSYKSITYNNIAQYCKQTNKTKTGIKYLYKAQEIQIKQGNPILLADIHLNLCALLSKVEKHQEALEHILIAIILLQDQYNIALQQKIEESQNKENQEQKKSNDQEQYQDLLTKLAIAYHNMGVEFEYLKRFDESIQNYEKAVVFGMKYLGQEHQLVKQFQDVLNQASKQINDQKNKGTTRRKNNFSIEKTSVLYSSNNKQKKEFIIKQATKTGYQKKGMNQNKKLAATSQGFSSLNKENDNMERKENEKVETEKQIK